MNLPYFSRVSLMVNFFFMFVFMSGRIVFKSVRDISRIMLNPLVAEVARLKNGLV